MKTALWILVVLATVGIASATQQVPDVLYADGLKLALGLDWMYPSPLETYYYQAGFEYPFDAFSTANYRGHVATWKIVDGKLYLTSVSWERYEPNEANPKSYDYTIESSRPDEIGVRASCPASEEGDVRADWFNGVLDCYLIQDGNYQSYFFYVRDGNVVDSQIISEQEYDVLYDSSPDALTEELRPKYDMLVLDEHYVTYHFRLSEEDAMEYNGEACRLTTGWSRPSPLFGRYGNSDFQWPYNWTNREKCGAPHCHWRIRDGRLYLAEVDLYAGLSFDRIDTEVLDLDVLFPGEVVNGQIPADWVSGVRQIQHGHMETVQVFAGFEYSYYKVTELTYVRIVKGQVTESYTVPGDFDTENMPADTEPGLRRIIEDYRLPPAVQP